MSVRDKLKLTILWSVHISLSRTEMDLKFKIQPERRRGGQCRCRFKNIQPKFEQIMKIKNLEIYLTTKETKFTRI